MPSEVGRLHEPLYSSGTVQTNSLPNFGVLRVFYSSLFAVEAFDLTAVATRSFNIIRLTGALTPGGESTQLTFWIAHNVGTVKQIVGGNPIALTAKGPASIRPTHYLNGDGKADILWRDQITDVVAIWLRNRPIMALMGFFEGVSRIGKLRA